MPESRRFRLTALLAGLAVIAASVLPALPAAAEEPPAPEPTVSSDSTPEPTPEATPSSEPAPTDEPSAEPEPSATAEPSDEPTAAPTPSEQPETDAVTVSYRGTFNRLSTEDGEVQDDGTLLLNVVGSGFLRVDVSDLPVTDRSGSVRVDLIVPDGLVLADDEDTRFSQLATYSATTALVASNTAKLKQTVPRETAGLVTQTPAASAVHEVWVVLVSPSNGAKNTSVQTAAEAQTLVQFANSYWSEQSGGTVQFSHAGTVPWYKSAYSCKTQPVSLWNQAAAKAASLGFAFERNQHLMLLFPPNAACGSAIGLATIGGSINEGGVLWVKGGTDASIRKATTAHELGHNLSLGHADWLECAAAKPFAGAAQAIYETSATAPGISGCEVNYYGDIVDVMGYGIDGLTGGALSSPNAIRSGIWPSSAFVNATIGTFNYELQPLTANSGVRAVVVQAQDGTNYFVEYRTYASGTEDAPYAALGCQAAAGTSGGGICVDSVQSGVRILRMEPSGYYDGVTTYPGYQGVPGYDSYVIGHNATELQWNAADGAYSPSPNLTIQVVSTGATAVVQVTRVTSAVTKSLVEISGSIMWDSQYRVGDTVTAFLGDKWNADAYAYKWFTSPHNSGSKTQVAGETTQNYVIRGDDLGKDIWVEVTGSRSGQSNQVELGRLNGEYNLPIAIQQGFYQSDQPGAVSVLVTDPLTANPTGWPAETTFQYRWYRGSTATTATTAITSLQSSAGYQLTSADANKFVRVAVTATVPGYAPVTRYSTADNYTMTSSGVSTIIGAPFGVGLVMTVDKPVLDYFRYGGVSITEDSVSYQWLRNGVAITGNPDATDDEWYSAVGADYGQKISLRITAHKAGRVDNVYTTQPKVVTLKGEIAFSSPSASITNAFDASAPGKATLTANVTGITEPGTTLSYQWYRVNRTTNAATVITNAKAQVYKPVAADYPYKLRVRITVSKTNYNSVPFDVTRDFSLRIDPATPLGFDGVAVKVTNTIGTNYPDFHAEIAPGTYNTVHWDSPGMTQAWQWYRSGVKVTGATSANFALTAADQGKQMAYTVVAAYPGYLSYSATSPKTVAVAPTTFTSGGAPLVLQNGLVLTADAALTDINPNATSMSYQWYRNGAAISKATGRTYTLVAADYGTTTTVVVTYKKPGYVNKPVGGDAGTGTQKYWISATDPVPVVTGAVKVGGLLTADPLDYFNENDPSGIPLALGTQVKVKYQWMRNGVAIAGADATDGDYTLTSLDKGKTISLRIIASDTNAPAIMLPKTSTSVATQPIGTREIEVSSAPTVTVAKVTGTDFVTKLQAVVNNITEPGVSYKYQWYRDGSAVKGQTTKNYTLSQSDKNKKVWVRVTITKKATKTDSWTPIVVASVRVDYTITGPTSGPYVNLYDSYRVGQQVAPLFVQLQYGGADVTNSDVRQTFQWFRSGKKITGGTGLFYRLTKADLGKKLTVQVISSLVGGGYVPHVAVYTANPSTMVVTAGALDGTSMQPTVQTLPGTSTLKAVPPPVTGALPSGDSSTPPNASFTYQWLRNGAAIKNATKATYVLASADSGKDISVRVKASLTGYVGATLPVSDPLNYNIKVITGSEPYISIGAWAPGNMPALYHADFITKDGALSGHTVKYQWLRNGVAISGSDATDDGDYTLQPADVGKLVSLRLTVSKPGYLPLTYTTTAQLGVPGVTITAPTPTIVPGTGVGTLAVQFAGLDPVAPAPAYSYKWYRAGVTAPIATTAQYKLVAADAGKQLTVKVTMTRAGFTQVATLLADATSTDHALYASTTKPTIDNMAPKVGDTLTATAPDFYTDTPPTTVASSVTPVFTWYRGTTAISGQTGPTYTLQAADQGKAISVKVTGAAAGRLAAVTPASLTTAAVQAGVFQGSFVPELVGNSATKKKTVTVTGTTITSPSGFSTSYVWKRSGVTVSGAKTNSLTLVAADSSRDVTVTITLTKPGYTTKVITVHANEIYSGEDVGIVPAAGATWEVAPPIYYFWNDNGSDTVPLANQSFQWFVDGNPVAGDVGSPELYTPTLADSGKTLTVVVTAPAPYHLTRVDSSADPIVIP